MALDPVERGLEQASEQGVSERAENFAGGRDLWAARRSGFTPRRARAKFPYAI